MKSFFRFLRRNPFYTIINIIGLAIALMFVILIGDYTWRQFSTDSMHQKKDRIVLLGSDSDFFSWPDASVEIGRTFPEIEKICRLVSQGGTIRSEKESYTNTDDNIILLADSTFLDFFDFKMVAGDRKTALSSPEKCVITESFADFMFGDENPVGQPLRLIGQQSIRIGGQPDLYDSTLVYTVSAVIKDFDKTVLPNDTRLIINYDRFPQVMGYTLDNYVFAQSGHGANKTFLMLNEGASLEPKIDDISKYIYENVAAASFFNDKYSARVTPLRKLMFAPQNDDNSSGLERGDKGLLTILLSSIFGILLFAMTNYINLTVANTGMRSKEMATRRLLGSQKREITLKLIGESILMVAISFLIGLGLAFLIQNDIASLFQGKIILGNDINAGSVSVCVAFILFTGLLAGLIPGLQLSRYKPIDIVKGTFRFKSKMVFSRIFIMLQNAITVVMLTASLVILLQINHLVNAPLGFNTKDVLTIHPPVRDEAAILSTLEQLPCIEKIGYVSGSELAGTSLSMNWNTDKEGNNYLMYVSTMDRNALEIYGLQILEDYGGMEDACYVNEKLVADQGLVNGEKEIVWKDSVTQIRGIVKDFHCGDILKAVNPFTIYLKSPEQIQHASYLVKTDGSADAEKRIREAVNAVASTTSDWLVTSSEKEISSSFNQQREILRIVAMFTAIAIVISILGFVGMALFFTRQRRKEIAVRRIMGGSIREVISLMLSRFCAPLLISAIVAVPIAYWIADRWLQDFSYRISLSVWIFAVTCAVSILIAALSVFWQIVMAAQSNPADSIKSE